MTQLINPNLVKYVNMSIDDIEQQKQYYEKLVSFISSADFQVPHRSEFYRNMYLCNKYSVRFIGSPRPSFEKTKVIHEQQRMYKLLTELKAI